MFPTTVWTRIHEAGAKDEAALSDFAERYRGAVLEFIQRRGFRGATGEDLCQDVFLRVLRGGVLAKADRSRGRFRSLLLAVTMHVIHDHLRKRREVVLPEIEPQQSEPDFDRGWALHLTERAMDRMREEESPYFDVLAEHVGGVRQDRNRLWIARRKLAEMVRREIAGTCGTREDFEEEVAYLARFLGPSRKE